MRDKIITVLENQTLFDIALQEYGDATAVFDIMENNKAVVASITADLIKGTRLKIVGLPKNKRVKEFLETNKIKPTNGQSISNDGVGDFNDDFNPDFS